MTTTAIVPFDHQQAGYEHSKNHLRFGWFWQSGTGKTILILWIYKQRPMRTLVVAGKSIIWSAWVKQAAKVGVPITVVHHTNVKKRIDLIQQEGDHILITNYEQFRKHIDLFIESGVQRVVFDESSKLKNRKTKISETAWRMGDSCKEVYLLSGTPSPNCETELWSQLRTLSPRAAGLDFYKWAYKWFLPVVESRRDAKSGKERTYIARWIPKKERRSEFIEYLRSWSQAKRKEECVDLPPQLDSIRTVHLSKSEQRMYNQVIEELRLVCEVHGSEVISSVHSAAVLMKLRQLTGGSVKVEGNVVEVGSSKIDDLMQLSEEYGSEPAIIWGEFTADLHRISRRLTQEGYRTAIINGETSKIAQPIIDKFMAGELDRVILHPRAAGHGTDGLQEVCQYAVYFGLSFSAEEHMQSRDRLHRSGQLKEHVTYTYLLSKNTIDEQLFQVVRKKSTVQQALLKLLST